MGAVGVGVELDDDLFFTLILTNGDEAVLDQFEQAEEQADHLGARPTGKGAA